MSSSEQREDQATTRAHTPGPWLISSSYLVCTEDAAIVARCDPIGVPGLDIPFEESIANTLLIAAAPELLEALKVLRASAMVGPYTLSELVAADAAIAKASGGCSNTEKAK